MKKIILFAGLLFCSLTNAQEIVSVVNDGVEIEDGQVFTFNQTHTLQVPQEVKVKVTNLTDANINLKMRMESITNNSEGQNLQFCFAAFCYNDAQEGTTVPPEMDPTPEGYITLAPGASNPNGDHFASGYTGDTQGEPVEYTIVLLQVDAEGTQIGEPLRTFTYKYDANAMSVDDFNSLQNMGIALNNTIVKEELNLNSAYNATMQIYAINGQLVKTAEIRTGAQSLNLSDLNAAVYIAKFTTEENKTAQIRIVKN